MAKHSLKILEFSIFNPDIKTRATLGIGIQDFPFIEKNKQKING